jgi:hypothetical protein
MTGPLYPYYYDARIHERWIFPICCVKYQNFSPVISSANGPHNTGKRMPQASCGLRVTGLSAGTCKSCESSCDPAYKREVAANVIIYGNPKLSRSQWPCGLRRRTVATRLLRLWVRIPPGEWIFVCCACCMLSGRGLCDELINRPEESYRLCCIVVCDLETWRMRDHYPRRVAAPQEKRIQS